MNISLVLRQQIWPAGAPPPVPQEQLAERKRLMQAVSQVNESAMLGEINELTSRVDRRTRKVVVRVINRQTGEIVFELTPDYVLRMAEELKRNS
jgi:uncharacterized FlaG/YvyC family protein